MTALLENIRLAWESLAANRARAALTMLGIIIGVSAVITVVAVGRGSREAVLSQFEQYSTTSFQMYGWSMDGSMRGGGAFTDADIDLMKRQIPEVNGIMPEMNYGVPAKWNRTDDYANLQVGPPFALEMLKLELGDGRWINEDDEARAAKVLVVGPEVVQNFFGGEDPVGETVTIWGQPWRIIGTLSSGDSPVSHSPYGWTWFAPFNTMKEIFNEKTYWSLTVDVVEGAKVNDVIEEAKYLMGQVHPELQIDAWSMSQMTESITESQNTLTAVIGSIAGISLIVGGVGIMNIMLTSVTERTREIGVRKAIGARRGDILTQFLIEAVVVSLFGGLLGVAFAYLPIYIFGKLMSVPAAMGLDSVILATTFSLAVGVIFGVYPAMKAAAQDPIDALRYE